MGAYTWISVGMPWNTSNLGTESVISEEWKRVLFREGKSDQWIMCAHVWKMLDDTTFVLDVL